MTQSLMIYWDGMRHETIICPTWYPLSSVATGISTPPNGQASNSVAIVRGLRSTSWSFARHSVHEQDTRTGIGGIYIQARWSLWYSTDYAWEQCESLIGTSMLFATLFSVSLTRGCLQFRFHSPGQYESTHL